MSSSSGARGSKRSLIISTPAKLILSGEHSVVYGAPAIGSPLGLFMRTEWAEGQGLRLRFQGKSVEIAPSWDALAGKLAAYRARYAAFKSGAGSIKAVLPEGHDLAALALAAYHERFPAARGGLLLSIQTDIPVFSGLGSSSSLILNLLQGMLKREGREMPDLLDFARGIEDFQHGTSSGLDLALVSSKTPLVYVRGQGVVRSMKRGRETLSLVHSGAPSVSTGECVAYVRERFSNDNALWADFSACTRAIEKALEENDAPGLQAGVTRNQELLEKIGVVPEKVRAFVAECRAAGVAAKVCGAGAVAGDAAGMIWTLGDASAIARKYGYGHGLYAAG
jgi:mevalonate kinase